MALDPELSSYLEAYAEEPLALLMRLCRQPSVSAQGTGMEEMAALTEAVLREAGFATRQLAVPGAPPAIYGELPGRSDYTLLLYDHYDVQPPEPYELWQSPPFEPTVRDGKLYACGAADDKGEIAARLSAIAALRAVHGMLPITIKYLIEGEEEIGSPHFAAFAEHYREVLQADHVLWEGAGLAEDGRPQVVLGFKGLLEAELSARSLSGDAHSSMAGILPSAPWRLIEALGTLRNPDGEILIQGFYDAVTPPGIEALTALDAGPDPEPGLRRLYGVVSFLGGYGGKALARRRALAPTCNIAGLLSGYTGEGMKTVLPARAMARLDFRLVPDQRPDAVLQLLRAHLTASGFGDLEVRMLGSAEPVVLPFEHPLTTKMIAIATAYDGRPPQVIPLAAGTLPLLGDFRRYVGVPGLATSGNPSYAGSGFHAPNEHIRVADLEAAVRYNCHLFMALSTTLA